MNWKEALKYEETITFDTTDLFADTDTKAPDELLCSTCGAEVQVCRLLQYQVVRTETTDCTCEEQMELAHELVTAELHTVHAMGELSLGKIRWTSIEEGECSETVTGEQHQCRRCVILPFRNVQAMQIHRETPAVISDEEWTLYCGACARESRPFRSANELARSWSAAVAGF